LSVATVRYFAGARAAAGITAETVEAASVSELLDTLGDRHGERLTKILGACSLLVDGLACREPATTLSGESTVDVLPPFAGG
jgi:molybdopterin synthase sulfur carrier subunit